VKPIHKLPELADPASVEVLVKGLKVPEPIAAVLVGRGYSEIETAKAFLRPELANLHDPWSLAGMEDAVARLSRAIDDGERILVHGDYDVDGVSGTALLTRALRSLGAVVEPFVPHRLKHGYDFGPAGLARAIAVDASLVLTCDCGIVSHETVAAASSEGIDVIVSDHHTPLPELPPAVAVINPQRPDCSYPEKVLCGAGVAFKLLQALYDRRGKPVTDLYRYLDLVAIPTIADLVPLTGENRILARFGLKVLARTPNPGLRALLNVAGIRGDRPINAGQIAFIIGPRINAVGRMGDSMRGVKLLLTDDETEAREIAAVVDEENRIRQEVDRATLEEANEILEASFDPERDRSIVLASPDWHSGVIGIVASRIVEKYYRPTVLIALDGNAGKGSGRSIPGFHLYEALDSCKSHLEQFGGHRYAAGVQIRADKIDDFRRALDDVAHDRLTEDDLIPRLRIDRELPISQVSAELWRFLAHFGPYGQGNPKPVFLARDVTLRGPPEIVGSDHLRLRVEVGDGASPEAIAFGQADESEWLDESSRVDMAYQVGVRSWQGIETVQAQVIDLRPSETVWATSES
jgi:single-stranded-DNA-specific exonuclease